MERKLTEEDESKRTTNAFMSKLYNNVQMTSDFS